MTRSLAFFLIAVTFAQFGDSASSDFVLKNEIEESSKLNSLIEDRNFPWPLLNTVSHDAEKFRAKRGSRGRRNYNPAPNFIQGYCSKDFCFQHEKYWKIVFLSDCIQVVANPGTYIVRPGLPSERACGVYIAGLHDELITIDITYFDVTCSSDGIVAVSYFFLDKNRRIYI